jgi:hypothetical protein
MGRLLPGTSGQQLFILHHADNMPAASRNIITMVLWNRPAYTRAVLTALRGCSGIGDYLLLPHVEPGNDEVLSLVQAIEFAETRLTLNPRRLGIGKNTYLAWQEGFTKSDFIIHIEDDTVPARDCLRYLEHCRRAYRRDHEVFSVSSYNRLPCPPNQLYHISRRPPYTCWLVGIWKDRWEWIRSRWSTDPERYATHLTNQVRRYRLDEIYPLLSRSQNIGAERGVHVPSAEWHRANHYTEHWAGNFNLRAGKYREVPRPL